MLLKKTFLLPGLKGLTLAGIALIGMMLGSCHKDDPAKPQAATVKFTVESQTLDLNETNALQVNLSLSNPLETAGTVVISIDNSSTAEATDYTTDPEASSGKITLKIPKGSSDASFTVTPTANVDNKTIVFKLSAATGGVTPAKSGLTTTITIKKAVSNVASITTSGSNLDDFGEIENGKVSGSKSFTVSGSNLTSDISVTASDNFLVSLDDQTFSDSLGIDFNTANSGPATVYVQFAPVSGYNMDITGNITLSSSGADDKKVAVSGTETGNTGSSLIFNENFDYGSTETDLVNVSTDWIIYSGATNPIQYKTSGLSFTDYGGSAIGGSILIENGSGSRIDVTRPITSQSSGTVYMAVLMKVYTAEADPSATGGDFPISLTDNDGKYFNRLYMKDDGSGNLSIGVAKTRNGGGEQVYAATAFKYNTTYLIVIKYDFSKKESSMFVLDGSIPESEPGTADVTVDTGDDPTSFDNIIIRQSNHALTATIDGIRVAKTWKDVLGL